MVKKTDTEENAHFEGTVTIVQSDDNPDEYGYGDLEVEGTIFVDKILQNTDNIGINIEEVYFNDGYFDMTELTSPVIPGIDTNRFFTNNQLLKSLDSASKLTTYQPTNTRGDILVHGINTQERLDIGIQGQLLTVDNTRDVNVRWVSPSGGDISQKTKAVLIDSEKTSIINKYYGSYYTSVFPFTRNGSSCNVISTKSRPDLIIGNSIILNINPSTVNTGFIDSIWEEYQELDIYKTYSESQGEYSIINNNTFSENIVSLSGTSWVNLGYSATIGIFFISIFSKESGGASVSFFICKNDPSSNYAGITKISSSPGTFSETIELKWDSGSVIQIRKTNSGNDGDYIVIDNHQFDKNISVSLSGTSETDIPKEFFRYYENKTFVVKVEAPSISGSPKAIFLYSKNSKLLGGNKSVFQIKGITSEESLNISWNANSLLKLSKSGNNYDGSYNIHISQI